jgi:hypothetical protein
MRYGFTIAELLVNGTAFGGSCATIERWKADSTKSSSLTANSKRKDKRGRAKGK